MPRFYYPHFESLCLGQNLQLPEQLVRHIQVLRLRAGDDLVLFDGKGQQCAAVLQHLGRREAVCELGEIQEISRESCLKITLIQAVSSSERMDFTVQKSVELGVSSILPVVSERSSSLSGERAEKKIARWQEIAISACEQCGRNVVPKILPLMDFQDYLAQKNADVPHLMMSLNQAKTLAQLPRMNEVALMVGPEGGWSAKEEAEAQAAGVQAMTLGPRVLRTETASIAAMAAMQTLWGDFG